VEVYPAPWWRRTMHTFLVVHHAPAPWWRGLTKVLTGGKNSDVSHPGEISICNKETLMEETREQNPSHHKSCWDKSEDISDEEDETNNDWQKMEFKTYHCIARFTNISSSTNSE